MALKAEDVKKAQTVKKESKHIDFKESFDVNLRADWCEVIKDIVAMANSGGGMILIGVKDDGTLSGFDVTPLLSYDSAKVTDKIATYTGEHFCDFEIGAIEREEQKIAVVQINSVSTPMVFSTEGAYPIEHGKTKTAFAKGTVYFRHGSKSEPGNTNDLRGAVEREVASLRKSWFSNIRKVVEAPPGYHVNMLPPEAKIVHPPKPKRILPAEIKATAQLDATPVRLTNDPAASAYHLVKPDQTHPLRMKSLLSIVNQRLGSPKLLTQHDIICVRKVYDIDNRPDYYYKSQFSSPQYSGLFIDWLIASYRNNPSFFDEAKNKCRA